MASKVVLRRLGGSVVMTVPRKLLQQIELDAGSAVQLTVDKGRLIVEPQPRPKYTLDELLAKCQKSDLAPSKTDRVWLDDAPRGKELI